MRKVLCLHGWRSNKEILKFQLSTGITTFLSGTDSKFKRSSYDFVCVDGCYPSKEGDKSLIPLNEKLKTGNGFYEWYDAQEIEGEYEYVGIQKSVEYILEIIRKSGKFDVILGFSQGGLMVSYLCHRLMCDPSFIPCHLRWNTAVIIEGRTPRDKKLIPTFQGELCFNMIHLMGEKCFMFEGSKNNAAFFDTFKSDRYTNTSFIYPEDHRLPSLASSKTIIKKFYDQLETNLGKGRLWCFDFDGVICDSVLETGYSGYLTGKRLVAEEFNLGNIDESQLLEMFRSLRPQLHIGYEAIILCWLCIKECKKIKNALGLEENISKMVLNIVKTKELHNLSLEFCSLFNLDIDTLKREFKQTRVDLIENNKGEWLARHEYFIKAVAGFSSLLNNETAKPRTYIITTKQKIFALELFKRCSEKYNIPMIDEDHVFGLAEGPKEKVLESLIQEHKDCTSAVFVEDRVSTLQKVVSKNLAFTFDLLVATYGYNTEEQRLVAEQQNFKLVNQKELHAFIESKL